MLKRTNLCIYLPSLASGGAERLHINLAPLLIEKGYDVTFIVHRAEGAFAQSIPSGVKLVSLECNRTIAALLPLVRYLRREKPDLLLANFGHSNVIAILATLLARTPTSIIVTQHNALSHESARKHDWRFNILPWLYRIFLPKADGIVAVSKGVAQELVRMTGLESARISVIYNPIVTSDFDAHIQIPADHPFLNDNGPPFILAVGRMTEQKGFDILLNAFAEVIKTRDIRLLILGEGPLQEQLVAQVHGLGIDSRVSMPGFHPHPLAFMSKAAMLVMSSRYEGFGNVLVEALACGTPVVSTDCPYGPSEILDNGRFGSLVPVEDAEALTQAILHTLKAPIDSEILRTRGHYFSAERAGELYIQLFEGLRFNSKRLTLLCA